MNIQRNILLDITINEIKAARSVLNIGDKVFHKKTGGVDWSQPCQSHKVNKGGIITYMSPYVLEIKVRWLESGAADFINPLDVERSDVDKT